jgi:hypothetical protein
MVRQPHLSDVGEAIDVLGGNVAVQNLTGARKTTVWWWRKNNRFPSKYYVVISDALRPLGYVLDASVCGQVREPEAADAP